MTLRDPTETQSASKNSLKLLAKDGCRKSYLCTEAEAEEALTRLSSWRRPVSREG
uniref:Uncharacterized protein n=1 Tax=Anguilla anguilla TaxID=7936 RepID=A0A0E9TYY0_ANGAN